MSELRKDPIMKRWVIVASERSLKPYDFPSEGEVATYPCAFCPGQERLTPPEVFSFRKENTGPDQPGWTVRVIPNKFPAVQASDFFYHADSGLFEKMAGVGVHEVIIETPEHYSDLADLPVQHIEKILHTFCQRMEAAEKDPKLKYCLIFKNQGKEAGASIQHPHSQLIAIPVVPKRVEEELEGAREYFYRKKSCVFCDLIREEMARAERVILVNSDFLVCIPYAARFPYEIWILPIRHTSSFLTVSLEEIRSLSLVLKKILQAIKVGLDRAPFNFILHVAPFSRSGENYEAYYHWHIEILPALTKIAGFEWGSGFYINPVIPEEAAQNLKNFVPKE